MEFVGLEPFIDISKVFGHYIFQGTEVRTIDNKASVVSEESRKTVCGAGQIISIKQKQKEGLGLNLELLHM